MSAEGETRDEVLVQLNEQLRARLTNGSELVSLEATVPPIGNPRVEFAGMFKDDPLFDDWQQAIAENRRRIDEDPSIP